MGRAKGVKETVNPDKKAIALANLEKARQVRLKKLNKEKSEHEPKIETKEIKEIKEDRNEPPEPIRQYESDDDEEDILFFNQPTAYEIYQEEQRILKAEKALKEKQRHKKLKSEISELKKLTSELKDSMVVKKPEKNDSTKSSPYEEKKIDSILRF